MQEKEEDGYLKRMKSGNRYIILILYDLNRSNFDFRTIWTPEQDFMLLQYYGTYIHSQNNGKVVNIKEQYAEIAEKLNVDARACHRRHTLYSTNSNITLFTIESKHSWYQREGVELYVLHLKMQRIRIAWKNAKDLDYPQ
jgi:hypothetical protein